MKRFNLGQLFVNAGVAAVAFLAVGLLCELLTRVIFGDAMVLTPRYHTSAQYGDVTLRRNRPDMTFTHTTPDGSWEFRTNAQGFRNDHDFEYPKPPGRIRVVAIGDSHTQGHEAHQDYTYAAIIERYLRARGVDAEVLNTGVSGFSTAEAYLLLQHELLRYQPDYVVLGFFANDYEDNLKAGMFQLDDDGEPVLVKREYVPGVKIQDLIYSIPGIQWLGENSYFYSVLFNSTWDFLKARRAESAREAIPTEYAVPTKSDLSEFELQLAAELIDEIQKAAASAGAKFILLDIPTVGGPNRFLPSVVPEMLRRVDSDLDHVVYSEPLLKDYQGAAQFHVPNAGRHITAFTHTVLGVAAARYILQQAAPSEDS